MSEYDYDYIVVGSGFGGAVSALRLAQKGYRVLVLEKGRRFRPEDFPKTTWSLRRWLWLPALRFFGIFKITLFRHVMVFSGVGVGGGSLVYANTLARPIPSFFDSPAWSRLADWRSELAPHYETVLTMLGAAENPQFGIGDEALRTIADERGRLDHFAASRVAVHFGEPGVESPDPYFGGNGPSRSGCTHCGACMTGCRHNAKNTLDKNYLYLAEGLGVRLLAQCEVYDVAPLEGSVDGSAGYRVSWRKSNRLLFGRKSSATAAGVVFAGGVMGTVPLLLRLRNTSLPSLSERIGSSVRTNSEALLGVTAPRRSSVFSEGVAIGSILRISDHTTVEPVRYGEGSGVWRLLMAPMADGPGFLRRSLQAFGELIHHPIAYLKVFFVDDWAKRTQILLFMQSIESTLRLVRTRFGLRSRREEGAPPQAFIPEARELTRDFARIVGGKPMALITETVTGIPNTAHILGGCVIADGPESGVVDARQRVFGYENVYICDGSVIPANLGANPSLTIAALAERAMSAVPAKGDTGLPPVGPVHEF